MPIQLLDIGVAGIMLISGLLALMRGFTREVLSLVAWGVAAAAAFFAVINPELKQLANQYIPQELVATIALGAGVFIIVLIIVSLISIKIGDLVLDSAAGPFDRTVGFLYGVARGMLLVVTAYLGFIWLVPLEKRPDWVRDAYSLPAVESVGQVVISFLPSDVAQTLQSKTDTAGDGDTAPATPNATQAGEEGYKQNEQRVLDQIIDSTRSSGQ